MIWTKTEQHDPQKGGEGATEWQTRPVSGKYRFNYIQIIISVKDHTWLASDGYRVCIHTSMEQSIVHDLNSQI